MFHRWVVLRFACAMFLMGSYVLKAQETHRAYRIHKVLNCPVKPPFMLLHPTVPKAMLSIPKVETPKGAVFCRFEDFMTRKTKVWVKIGVR